MPHEHITSLHYTGEIPNTRFSVTDSLTFLLLAGSCSRRLPLCPHHPPQSRVDRNYDGERLPGSLLATHTHTHKQTNKKPSTGLPPDILFRLPIAHCPMMMITYRLSVCLMITYRISVCLRIFWRLVIFIYSNI